MQRKPLPTPQDWEYVKVKRSGVHGRGLFAALDIPKGTYIMEYRGEKVTKAEGTRRTEAHWGRGRVYTFELNKRYDIDGSPRWNIARLANQSCDPDAESQNDRGRKIWIVALRDIPKGKEITYDYNFPLVIPPPVCKCGTKDCRGYIVGTGYLKQLRAWLDKEGLPVPASVAKATKGAAKKSRSAAKRPLKKAPKKVPKRATVARRPAAKKPVAKKV